jgi:hypothetical protein
MKNRNHPPYSLAGENMEPLRRPKAFSVLQLKLAPPPNIPTGVKRGSAAGIGENKKAPNHRKRISSH